MAPLAKVEFLLESGAKKKFVRFRLCHSARKPCRRRLRKNARTQKQVLTALALVNQSLSLNGRTALSHVTLQATVTYTPGSDV